MTADPALPTRPPPIDALGNWRRALEVAVFGADAASEKARIWLRVAAWVMSLDIGTKIAANLLLAEHSVVSFGSDVVTFELLFDPTLIGTNADRWNERFPNLVFCYVAIAPIFLGLALPFASARAPLRRKAFVLGAGVYLPLLIAYLWGPHGVGADSVPPFAFSWASYLVTFSLLLLRLARSRIAFVLVAAVTSGGLCNLLNFAVDPRGVTDFVYLPALEGWLGTANLADLVLQFAGRLLIGWVCLSVVVGVLCRAPGIRGTRLSRALFAANPLL